MTTFIVLLLGFGFLACWGLYKIVKSIYQAISEDSVGFFKSMVYLVAAIGITYVLIYAGSALLGILVSCSIGLLLPLLLLGGLILW